MGALIQDDWVVDPVHDINGFRDIKIINGVVEQVDSYIAPKKGMKLINVKGKTVIPGIIAPHVHILQLKKD